ncbi:MAG: hypothetical protein AAFP76_11255 [Bacteroidota bacterium]
MKTKFNLLLLSLSLLCFSCASYYDHYTLTETVATKVMVESLFDKATTPYSENIESITELQQQLQKMLIYEKTKERNVIMQKMWGLLNSETSALQSFFTTWEAQGTMSSEFIEEFTPEISKQFDLMVDYESKKDKQAESALLQIINTVIN